MEQQVAQTIFNQLGGKKLVAMIGAYNTVSHSNGMGVSFRFKIRAKNGSNYVSVMLDPSDTYTVEFKCIRAGKVTDISCHSDIYADMLVELIEQETGLLLHL